MLASSLVDVLDQGHKLVRKGLGPAEEFLPLLFVWFISATFNLPLF